MSTTHQLPAGAVEWLANGERGASSEAIFERLTGIPVGDRSWRGSYPLDPDDLRRCRLLLEAVPAFRERLGEMRDVGPEWAGLSAHWDRLCALMDEEAPEWRSRRGSAPNTYALMRGLESEARRG